MIVQLDGCPIHNARNVRGWLDQIFPNKWIGRKSDIVEFLPEFPDHTPLDAFLWAYLKQKVYKIRANKFLNFK